MSHLACSLLLLAGCGSGALTGVDDGGTRDLSVAPPGDFARLVDLSSAPPDLTRNCLTIPADTQTYIDAHKSCAQDSDCVEAVTACGLPGDCGVALNGSFVAGLEMYSDAWTTLGCGGACPPCVAPMPVHCNKGVCQ